MTDYNVDGSKFGDQAYRDGELLQELYHGQGMTIPEIADHFGIADSTVFRWITRNGIETRKKGTGKASYVPFDIDGMGYERWKDKDLGNDTTVRVHQLLAISEGASPFDIYRDGLEVHHKNGIPWDNRPENIEVLSPGEHMSKHNRGSNSHNSKLTEADVKNIRNRHSGGESTHSIARSYPVTLSHIQRICSGDVWTHVE